MAFAQWHLDSVVSRFGLEYGQHVPDGRIGDLSAGAPNGIAAYSVTVILADWFATIGVVVTLRLMDAAGHLSDPTLLTTPDSGTSALAWGGMAAGAMVAFPRYRRSLLALLAVAMAIQFMVETTIPAVAHGYAVLFGLGAGALYLRRSAASA